MANEGLASIGVRQTAMYMERRTRVRQTEMPNEIAEGLGSLRSPGVGCIKPLNRGLDLPPQAGFVEGQHAAPRAARSDRQSSRCQSPRRSLQAPTAAADCAAVRN